MRVGILTYHCVPNFGAQLQAMSTVGYLKKNGHTPVLLHWYPKDLEELYVRRVPKIQRKCHKRFTEENYPLSSLCRNEKQLIKEIEQQQLDMIITGSDALFKYKPRCDRRRGFSKRRLRFVNNFVSCEDLQGNPFFCSYYGELSRQIPVVAFSVSSQSCPYYKMTEEEKDLMGLYMRNFKKITVRDRWTKQMVEEIAGLQDIRITPDPVFAFNQNCYIHIPTIDELRKRFSLPEHYILFSFSPNILRREYVKSLENLLRERGIKIIALPEPEGLGGYDFENFISLPLSPIEWYALIKHSSGFVGTRMHPVIVSLHNAVPFFSFDTNGTFDSITGKFNQKSSKIYDILAIAGFEKNTYSLYCGEKVPDIITIKNKLFSFDRDSCAFFSHERSEMFMEEMRLLF